MTDNAKHISKDTAKDTAEEIRALHEAAAGLRDMTFMEVCGTHTMSAFRSGLPSVTPTNITLLSGPGCPVCVTAQGDIDQMIELAFQRNVALCTYGDMLRVPGCRGSLEMARAQGADVRVLYSAVDAVQHAEAQPNREFVFAAVGFETTAPATAAAIQLAARRGLRNFSVLVSHKLVVPAITALLDSERVKLDGLLCPGHVSVIIGSEAYRPVVDKYGIPCVIAGFEEQLMVSALAVLSRQVRAGRALLVNQYPEAVTQVGNVVALRLLDEVFRPVAMRWRGLGEIPESGLALRSEFCEFDAADRFRLTPTEGHEPAQCICGKVITGSATPVECELFGNRCTPIRPVGPCMVSSEGTCQAWFKYRRPLALRSHYPVADCRAKSPEARV